MLLALLPFVEERHWRGAAKWLLLPAAAVVLTSFVGWERRHAARGQQPVVDLDLFRVRSYALGSALGLAYFAGFTSIFFVFTLYLQAGLRYSALLAGASTLPFALGAAAASALGGRRVTSAGARSSRADWSSSWRGCSRPTSPSG